MKTTPEMTLLNYCEIHGHAESASILRAIVEKQRTPHSDTDAHPENQGSDLFAANAGITPEQARFAYDHAMRQDHRAPDDPGYITSMANQQLYAASRPTPREMLTGQQTAPTQAVPCDSRPLTASDIVKANEAHEAYWREHDIQDPSWYQGAAQLWYALGDAMKLNLRGPKHRWIYSDGSPRQEPCCR
jgi:hypothetical protein